MPKLIFTKDPFAGRVYELTLEKTTVGRGDQNTLALHAPSVSLAHCKILVHGPEVIVHDLGSANGTFVAGVKVNGQAQIKHGQNVRFGSVEARLELDVSVPDDTISGMDTVQVMSRIMRDQRREERKPKPGDPVVKLDPDAGSEPIDRTIMMSQPAFPQVSAVPPQPKPTEVPPGRSSAKWVLGIALGLGIVFLLWMFFERK